MSKKDRTHDYDVGNPEAAEAITKVAKAIAKRTGYDTDEFYEEFNRQTDPYQRSGLTPSINQRRAEQANERK